MTALIEQLFRLKFTSTIVVDDAMTRERRIAELRALLAEIAEPDCGIPHREELSACQEERESSFA